MHHLVTIAVATMALAAPDAGEFKLQKSDPAKAAQGAQGAKPSKILSTKTEAAMKFFVIEKDKGPVRGVVIMLTSDTGERYYTEETDADGYAEALVPVGKKYEITYLVLGRKDIAANVTVTSEPKQTIKLTLRFKRMPPPPPSCSVGSTSTPARQSCGPSRRTSWTSSPSSCSTSGGRRSRLGHANVGKAKTNKECRQSARTPARRIWSRRASTALASLRSARRRETGRTERH